MLNECRTFRRFNAIWDEIKNISPKGLDVKFINDPRVPMLIAVKICLEQYLIAEDGAKQNWLREADCFLEKVSLAKLKAGFCRV